PATTARTTSASTGARSAERPRVLGAAERADLPAAGAALELERGRLAVLADLGLRGRAGDRDLLHVEVGGGDVAHHRLDLVLAVAAVGRERARERLRQI